MKRKFANRYTVTTKEGNKYWGTCPQWLSDFKLLGVTAKVERVLVVGGKVQPCHYHSAGHPEVATPFEVEQ